jgi:hypothetical protein
MCVIMKTEMTRTIYTRHADLLWAIMLYVQYMSGPEGGFHGNKSNFYFDVNRLAENRAKRNFNQLVPEVVDRYLKTIGHAVFDNNDKTYFFKGEDLFAANVFFNFQYRLIEQLEKTGESTNKRFLDYMKNNLDDHGHGIFYKRLAGCLESRSIEHLFDWWNEERSHS